MSFASLCFLSYQRPEFIREAVRSAVQNAGWPCEVLVHDDGSDPYVREVLVGLMDDGLVSHLMLSPAGHNQGVGTAINRMFSVAKGDVLVKLDQDLLFERDWLERAVSMLHHDPMIGALGLFRYAHDPVDWRKMNHLTAGPGAEYVDDFVGSAIAIPRAVYQQLGPFDEHSDAFAEDVIYKGRITAAGMRLALPVEDLAVNRGFGPGPSTIVHLDDDQSIRVATIHHGPRIVTP